MSIAISSRSNTPAYPLPSATGTTSVSAAAMDGSGAAASSAEGSGVATSSTVEADFLKFARMTPEERVQQAVLSKLGMTEDEFNKLDSKAKGDVLAKVRDEILRQMDIQGERRTGAVADITV